MHHFFLILLFIEISICICDESRGTLYFEFISFNNPSSKKDNGERCDALYAPLVNDYCDVSFTLCIGSIKLSKPGKKCDVYRLNNPLQIFKNVQSIKFGKKIGVVDNPLKFPLWDMPDSVQIAVNISDNGLLRQELMASMHRIVKVHFINNHTSQSDIPKLYLRSKYSQLTIRVYGQCATGYYGPDCSVYCVPSYSIVGGFYGCDLATGQKHCLIGWTGSQCNIRDLCVIKNPCHGSSSCYMDGTEARCKCPNLLTGRYCETAVKPCDSNPCHNGGVCVRRNVSRWHCQCPSGFRGKLCKEDVDECDHRVSTNDIAAEICLNKGKCVNQMGSFRCICFNNYWGYRCEKPPVYRLYYVNEGNSVLDPLSQTYVAGNNNMSSSNSLMDNILIVMLSLVSCMLVMLVAVLLVYYYRKKKVLKQPQPPSTSVPPSASESYESIYSKCKMETDKKYDVDNGNCETTIPPNNEYESEEDYPPLVVGRESVV